MDADDAELALIELIIRCCASDAQTPEQVLLAELEAMRLKDLRKRAREAGISA